MRKKYRKRKEIIWKTKEKIGKSREIIRKKIGDNGRKR